MWWQQYQTPIQNITQDETAARFIYGDAYGIAMQLYQIQQIRMQTAAIQQQNIIRSGEQALALAQAEGWLVGNLDAVKDMASNIIIAATNAVAQQSRELDAMRARAQSPSLTNIALGPGAGRGISDVSSYLRPPNLSAQFGGGSGGGGVGGAGGTGWSPSGGYSAWWSWPMAGGGGGMGSAGGMGSSAPSPAVWMWQAGGGGGPANAPGQNAAAGMPGSP